jgi:hypothetical protein
MHEKPILHKRKNRRKIRTCQRIIDDGFYAGEEKICGRLVQFPNKFLCTRCLRDAESEEQATGRGE